MMKNWPPYRDFWLRFIVSVILAFFFVFLGSDSFADILQGKYFFADILTGFVLSFMVTSSINLITSYLDNQYNWNHHFATRLMYQLVAGVIIPAMFVLAYMYTYLVVILGFSKQEVQFFTTEFPISVLFIICWNALYVGYYYYRENKLHKEALLSLQKQLFTLQDIKTGGGVIPTLPESPEPEPPGEEPDFAPASARQKIRILVAVSGNKNIPIPVEQIAYFSKEGNYTMLKTFQSESYMLNHSLDELMKLLDESLFFRANRQFIVNLRACHFFTNEENGKLAVKLLPPAEEDVIISQKRAPAFKEWLHR